MKREVVTSAITDSGSRGPTPRKFLGTVAAGAAWWACGQRAHGQITGAGEPKLTAYDGLMTRFMREQKPPGAALAVAYHGRLVYARGFGYADVEQKEPSSPLHCFALPASANPSPPRP